MRGANIPKLISKILDKRYILVEMPNYDNHQKLYALR